MKAAVLHGKEDVRVEHVATRDPGPGEVRLDIHAALTCGTDLKVYKRGYHARMLVPPAVFGHEMAGVVGAVGAGVETVVVGDRVVVANSAPCGRCVHCGLGQENLCDDLLFLNGAYAESIVVPARLVERNLLKLKSSTAFVDAALVEPLACVVQGLSDLRVLSGERLLVVGSGPIGLMFVALARDAGCEVTVAGRGTERLSAALKLGAARAVEIDSAAADPGRELRERAGKDFDVVVEAVGKPEAWEAAVQVVRKGGRVNFFGGCPAGTTIRLDTGLIHYSNLTLLASFHHTPATIRRALEEVEGGRIRAADFVTGECVLDGLPELFRSMAAGNRAVKTLIRTRTPA